MSVYATGDCHGNFRRFGRKYFPEQANLARNDFVIICGDFGGLWESSAEENYWLDWLNDKPWTTLWVDGNHENFTLLSGLPIEMWHGGMVHRVRANILHLRCLNFRDIPSSPWAGPRAMMWRMASWTQRHQTLKHNS